MVSVVGLHIAASWLLALISALYLGPLFISIAYKVNLLDRPDNNLKKHTKATPYLGGLVVYGAFSISVLCFMPFNSMTIFFLLGTSLLLILGLADDVLALTPMEKLNGQVIATICLLRGGLFLKSIFIGAQHGIFFQALWVCISAIWILTIINALNLVDVMDGLATTIALASSCAFLLVAIYGKAYSTAIILAAFNGALLGFYWYNKPQARMYLGDAGSLFLGGVLGAVPFLLPWGTLSPYGYLVPPVILLIPILEVLTLIIIRTYKRIPFYRGSPHHFCHFLKPKFGTIYLLLYILIYSLLLTLLCMAFLTGGVNVGVFAATTALFVIVWYIILIFISK